MDTRSRSASRVFDSPEGIEPTKESNFDQATATAHKGLQHLPNILIQKCIIARADNLVHLVHVRAPQDCSQHESNNGAK